MTLFDTEASTPHVTRTAIIDETGRYRYALSRIWDTTLPLDLWIMCNPSTADGRQDDPTIRRCTGFSRRFGSGGFNVGNAYGYRATKPADMWAAQADGVDIIGPDNDAWLDRLARAATGRVILAWGAHPERQRAAQVAQVIRDAGRQPLCLGVTQSGQPRHPLMLRGDAELTPWTAA